MKKTIKELADELGVSKTAISKKVSANQKRKHFSKIGNKFVIDEEGQKIIKSMFLDLNENYRKPENDNQTQTDVFEVSDLVSVLKDRVSVTEKQLDEKDKQIASMQKLLDQQQILTLQANKKIAELEKSVSDPDETEEQTEVESNTGKKSFWSKLFG